MLGQTSSERTTVSSNNHYDHSHDGNNRPEYDAELTAATAVAAVSAGYNHNDDPSQFHQHQNYSVAAVTAAAELQHRAERQRLQQQLHQQELHHQQLLQQQHQHEQQQHQQQHHHLLQQRHSLQQPHESQFNDDYEGDLTSRYLENEIIKTFSSKQDLIKFVKFPLSQEERCKIVINSSKPKAVYFQCERSGSFRTTVKDHSKRQRVAYTKRSKCGYRLVANLYPPEKDKKKIKKSPESLDRNLDDKLSGFGSSIDDQINNLSNEMWILRMICPNHNHPAENQNGKKKRGKTSRTLVEKPLHRGLSNGYSQQENLNHIAQQAQQHQHVLNHHHMNPHLHDDVHHHSVQDAAVIAAIEATPAIKIDPNIDPNVDPSVQAHDHSHIRNNLLRR